MPTYEYECQRCDHRFELFQSIKAKPVRKCPECSGTVNRLIGTGAGLIFKGSGFYQTDYRSADYKKAAEAEKPAAKSDGKSGATSEGKSGTTDGAKPAATSGTPKDASSKGGKKPKGKSTAA